MLCICVFFVLVISFCLGLFIVVCLICFVCVNCVIVFACYAFYVGRCVVFCGLLLLICFFCDVVVAMFGLLLLY